MATFSLSIELGNDAMQTPENVARALRVLAHRLDADLAPGLEFPSTYSPVIRDENGNTVGRVEVTA